MPKKGIFWPFLTDFETLRIPFPAATVEFLAQTLCDCTSHPRYHPPKFQPNPKHHNRVLIFPHFARAAAACCC